MNGLRKVIVVLLSIALLGSLLGAAFATGAQQTVANQAKVEKWLSESKLYDHFVSNAVEQAQKSVGSVEDAEVTSLSDTAVQDAAKSAFSQQLVETSINQFIASNYAWLEGKTKTPEFTIDLTAAKQSFAQQVGAYVTTHLASLPVCTSAQLAQIQNVDPLTITCRPSNIDPKAEGARVTQQIAASDDFLSETVLTPQNINPDPASQSDPYYEKFAQLPKTYQFAQKLPFIFAGLALLSAIVLVFLSARKRSGLRLVGIIFAIAGVLLVVIKFASDVLFQKLEDRVFNPSTTGELQHSLTSFSHLIEKAAVQIEFIFGVAFLAIALIILIILRSTRAKDITVPEPTILNDLTPIEDTPNPTSKTPKLRSSPKAPRAKTKKPPRLVQ